MSSDNREGSSDRNGDINQKDQERYAAALERFRRNSQNNKFMQELDRSREEWVKGRPERERQKEERLKKECLAKKRLEKERLEKERLEKERLAKEQVRREANRAINNSRRPQTTIAQQIANWIGPAGEGERSSPNEINDENKGGEPDDRTAEDGFKAGFMYFKKKDESSDFWEGYTHPSSKFGDYNKNNKYPHQKLTMRETLGDDKESPLREAFEGDDLRYFHFPGNNMSWIERAMEILNKGTRNKTETKTPATGILAREFWLGQMYGTGERSVLDRGSQMPAGPIHARHMRPRFSVITRGSNENPGKDIAIFLPYLHWETSGRRAKMVEIVNEVTRPEKKKQINEIPDVVEKAMSKEDRGKKKRVADAENQGKKQRSCLAEYWMAVAKVAEKIDYDDDEKLLRNFINASPPLHVRRTLDQYYFPTLEDTSARDKDQVVFRNTDKLYKRVVMVDQLWLWIINDNTIITSFPRRWGRNKPDSSGIHRSLRDRLKEERISSIYHLALIIIDQCSRVFFDRTKPLDQRPEVMDLFSSAIGNIIENTSTAYERFWDNLRMESNKTISVFGNTFNHRRLDINPEGIVLKEGQDIAEELRIMGRIFTDQWKVTKEFKRYLMYPEGERKEQPKELAGLEQLLLRLLAQHSPEQNPPVANASPVTREGRVSNKAAGMRRAVHEAEELLEAIESRREEIQDLEESAIRACQQIEGLLTLKQQQTSIVEAKAALRRADESVKQGRTIMAFTLVTIFFLPLGFVATFFGMNNRDINDAMWMSLDEQIRYMFVATIAAVIVSVSVAFSAWPRAICQLVVLVPLKWLCVHTGLQDAWENSSIHHENINRHTSKSLRELQQYKRKEKEKLEKNAGHETGLSAGISSGTDLSGEGEAGTGDQSSTPASSYGRARSFLSRNGPRRGSMNEMELGGVGASQNDAPVPQRDEPSSSG